LLSSLALLEDLNKLEIKDYDEAAAEGNFEPSDAWISDSLIFAIWLFTVAKYSKFGEQLSIRWYLSRNLEK